MNPDRPHRESFDLEGISHTVPIPFGTRVGDMLFSSGIMGVDPSTGSLAEGLSAQVRFAFANMERLLKKAGGDLGDVGHVRVLVSEEGNRAAVNEEWLRAQDRIFQAFSGAALIVACCGDHRLTDNPAVSIQVETDSKVEVDLRSGKPVLHNLGTYHRYGVGRSSLCKRR